MKKLPLITLMAAIALGACNKPKTGSQIYTKGEMTDTTVVVNTPDTSYYVSGLGGIVLNKFGKKSLSFSVVHTDGIQRNVKLEVAGAPANMKIEMSNNSGYTPFTSLLTFDTRFIAAGMYPITLTATPDKGETKVYTINVKVDSATSKESNDMFFSKIYGLKVLDTAKEELPVATSFYQSNKNGDLFLRNVPMFWNTSSSQSYMTTGSTSAADMMHLVKFNFNSDNGEVSIPEQTVRAIRNLPTMDTIQFKVSGKGMIDLENEYYELNYMSDSASFKIEGSINY